MSIYQKMKKSTDKPADNNDDPMDKSKSIGKENIDIIKNFISQAKAADYEGVTRRIPASKLNSVPLIVVEDTIAVPFVPQKLPTFAEENEIVISNAIRKNSPVVVLFKLDKNAEEPGQGLSGVGIIGFVEKYEYNPEEPDVPMFAFKGGERVKVKKIGMNPEGELIAKVEYYPIISDISTDECEALLLEIQDTFDRIVSRMENPDTVKLASVINLYHPFQTFLFALFSLPLPMQLKYEVLALPSLGLMMSCFFKLLTKEEKIQSLRMSIRKKIEKEYSDNQKESYIRDEISALQNELGEKDEDDVEALRSRAKGKIWNDETQKHFERELKKLKRYPTNTPDYSIQYNYLDNFVSLPWGKYDDSAIDLDRLEKILDRDHFGLEKVKERILEQMAVASLRNDHRSPIICLVGPPGVGKTSLGKSIAEALGRGYTRISFGGMHDEAEIRGHRRTYLGAMPGRIISSLSKLESSNPVMVLDEIDKIGKDFKGDPSTALLEVLDPEQNSGFHDNYLDADYDLSNILFIATANTLDTISAPLLDRMEIISLPGYITAEKIEIARRHLVPKQLKESGLEDLNITFSSEALEYLIEYYTREAGVRRLEKTIGKVLRRIAVKKVKGEAYPNHITKEIVSELLGKEEYNPEMYESNEFVGVVTGLAWTAVGGEILFIESSVTQGSGKLTLTGNLGDIMKESATIALQYLRAHANEIDVPAERFEKIDVHIHVPEGAIPKDGPSAGITMATSIASALTGRKVKRNLAMTGEITLRGKVLPVGGIKEKIIAAKRSGIKEIIISKENEKDILEINEKYLDGLTFSYVDTITEVLHQALL